MAKEDKTEAQESVNGSTDEENPFFKTATDYAGTAQSELERVGSRAKTWVEENPTLAVFLAVGAGMLAGRVLTGVFTPKPPPLSVQLKRRGRNLLGRAQGVGSDLADRAALAGGVLAHQAARRGREFAHHAGAVSQDVSKKAAKQARKAQKEAAFYASEAAHKASDFGDVLQHQAEVLSAAATQRAAELGDQFAHLAEEAYDAISHKAENVAHDISGRVKETADSSFSVLEAILNTIKTAVVAVAVKKITGWIRSVA